MSDIILYHPKVIQTPVWDVIPSTLVELQKSGHWYDEHRFPHEHDEVLALYEVDDDSQKRELCSFMTYRRGDADVYISLAYTNKRFRKRDYHTKLFNVLVDRAKKHGNISVISSGCHVDNEVAIKAFEKQGRKLVSLVYDYNIKVDFKDPSEV